MKRDIRSFVFDYHGRLRVDVRCARQTSMKRYLYVQVQMPGPGSLLKYLVDSGRKGRLCQGLPLNAPSYLETY